MGGMTAFVFAWWHWVLFAAALVVADVFLINVYFLFWLGLGAGVTGIAVLAYPTFAAADMPLWMQLACFTIWSSVFLVVWLVVLRPYRSQKLLREAQRTMPGQGAVVVRFVDGSGVLRLQRPIGGRDVWEFTCEGDVAPGDRVVVRRVSDSGVVEATAPPPAEAPPPKN